jgi:hypothetical protein
MKRFLHRFGLIAIGALLALPAFAQVATVGSQAGFVLADGTTSVARAFPSNVTAGNLVTWSASIYQLSADAVTAGDCTKTAGTATIDTPTLDFQRQLAHEADAQRIQAAQCSAIVTGSGSLTLGISGQPAGSYYLFATDELSSVTGWDASRVEATNFGEDATNSTTSSSSGNVTSAGHAAIYGVLSISTGATATITEDGAFTLIGEEVDGSTHQAGSVIRRIVSTGTTDAADWTTNTNTFGYIAAAVVYKPVAATGSGSPFQGPFRGPFGGPLR